MHLLDKWGEDPYSWGTEKVFHTVIAMRELLDYVIERYSYYQEFGSDAEQEMVDKVIGLAHSITYGR